MSGYMISGLKHLMGSNTQIAASRTRLQLPQVHVDSIVLVTNDSVCAALKTVYEGELAGRPSAMNPSGQVYVVRVGSVYVVRDPAITVGEWTLEMIISPQGVVLARLLG